MHQALRDKAVDIIESCQHMTVATNREDGFPQATVVSFISDGLMLFFSCGVASQKALNLTRDARASVAMTAPYDDWMSIRGVSMGVEAQPVTSAAEIEEVWKQYYTRFPQIADLEPVEPMSVTLFRLKPLVMSVLDYSQGFGHSETVRVDDNDIAESLESMAHRWLARVD